MSENSKNNKFTEEQFQARFNQEEFDIAYKLWKISNNKIRPMEFREFLFSKKREEHNRLELQGIFNTFIFLDPQAKTRSTPLVLKVFFSKTQSIPKYVSSGEIQMTKNNEVWNYIGIENDIFSNADDAQIAAGMDFEFRSNNVSIDPSTTIGVTPEWKDDLQYKNGAAGVNTLVGISGSLTIPVGAIAVKIINNTLYDYVYDQTNSTLVTTNDRVKAGTSKVITLEAGLAFKVENLGGVSDSLQYKFIY